MFGASQKLFDINDLYGVDLIIVTFGEWVDMILPGIKYSGSWTGTLHIEKV